MSRVYRELSPIHLFWTRHTIDGDMVIEGIIIFWVSKGRFIALGEMTTLRVQDNLRHTEMPTKLRRSCRTRL